METDCRHILVLLETTTYFSTILTLSDRESEQTLGWVSDERGVIK